MIRAIWQTTPDTREVAEDLICYAKRSAEEAICSNERVHFIISCITGIRKECKGNGINDGEPGKPGLSFIVCFSPSERCTGSTFVDILMGLGLSEATKVDVSECNSRKKDTDPDSILTNDCSLALKDYNSPYAKEILVKSLEHCARTFPRITFSVKPVTVILVNQEIIIPVTHMYNQLTRAGIEASIIKDDQRNRIQSYCTEPLKGADRALEEVLNFMLKNDYRIRRGYVYAKPKRAKVTYVRVCDIETFVHAALANTQLRSKVMIGHIKQLISVLGHRNFAMIKQLQMDQDLIEVLGGKCFDISKMEFIDTPIGEDEIGVRTPRAFFPYNHLQPPNPSYFIDTIKNSFPTQKEITAFAIKYYQLMFHHRHQMKRPVLMVVGPRDCGKTTIINPILELIPAEHVASLTPEKQFSCSMLNQDTELTMVDEFNEQNLTASSAKEVLQGGFMTTSDKHKSGRRFRNRSMFFFTAQEEPHWGTEDGNVKRRLAIFHMKKLSTVSGSVWHWLKDHAFECILWVSLQIKNHMDLVQDRGDLYFHLEEIPIDTDTVLMSELTKKLSAPAQVSNFTGTDLDFSNELFDDTNDPKPTTAENVDRRERLHTLLSQINNLNHGVENRNLSNEERKQQVHDLFTDIRNISIAAANTEQQQETLQQPQVRPGPSGTIPMKIATSSFPDMTSDLDDSQVHRNDGVPKKYLGGDYDSSPRYCGRGKYPKKNIDSERKNPFPRTIVNDCTDVQQAGNDDESDLEDENNAFDNERAMKTFTSSSVTNAISYLRCVRRCLVRGLDIPEGTSPDPTHYDNALEYRNRIHREARIRYVDNEYPDLSPNESEEMVSKLQHKNISVYDEPNVLYDAWGCIQGRCRSQFPVHVLMNRYPSLKGVIAKLRNAMNVTVLPICTPDISSSNNGSNTPLPHVSFSDSWYDKSSSQCQNNPDTVVHDDDKTSKEDITDDDDGERVIPTPEDSMKNRPATFLDLTAEDDVEYVESDAHSAADATEGVLPFGNEFFNGPDDLPDEAFWIEADAPSTPLPNVSSSDSWYDESTPREQNNPYIVVDEDDKTSKEQVTDDDDEERLIPTPQDSMQNSAVGFLDLEAEEDEDYEEPETTSSADAEDVALASGNEFFDGEDDLPDAAFWCEDAVIAAY